MFLCADGDTIGDQTANDLAPAVETVPDIHTLALFISGVPLCESRVSFVMMES